MADVHHEISADPEGSTAALSREVSPDPVPGCASITYLPPLVEDRYERISCVADGHVASGYLASFKESVWWMLGGETTPHHQGDEPSFEDLANVKAACFPEEIHIEITRL